jgi:DHA1 family bicyclomycin/chloramphenicol resistance-like MFS transporter
MSTAALAPFGRAAGAAASMLGFIQMGAGLLMGSLGALMGNAVIAMGTLIPFMGLTACLSFAVYRKLGPAIPKPLPTQTPEQCGPLACKTAPVTAPAK